MGGPEDEEDLDDVPRAVRRACSSPPMKRYGLYLITT